MRYEKSVQLMLEELVLEASHERAIERLSSLIRASLMFLHQRRILKEDRLLPHNVPLDERCRPGKLQCDRRVCLRHVDLKHETYRRWHKQTFCRHDMHLSITTVQKKYCLATCARVNHIRCGRHREHRQKVNQTAGTARIVKFF